MRSSEGRTPVGFAVDDRTVARNDDLQVLVGLPFDVNHFVKKLRL